MPRVSQIARLGRQRVHGATFEQQYGAGWIFAKPGRHDRASGTTPDDYDVGPVICHSASSSV
jgi:hypothetical protein